MKPSTEDILILRSSANFEVLLARFTGLVKMHSKDNLAFFSSDKNTLSYVSDCVDAEYVLCLLHELCLVVDEWQHIKKPVVRSVQLAESDFGDWESFVRRKFGCIALVSSSRFNRILFETHFSHLKSNKLDQDFITYFQTIYDKRLVDSNRKDRRWSDRVFDTLMRLILEGRTCSLKEAASALSVSGRTLQRELKSECTSFLVIKNSVRLFIVERSESDNVTSLELSKEVGLKSRSSLYRISSKRAA